MFLLASSHGKIEFCNNISVTSSVGCLFFFLVPVSISTDILYTVAPESKAMTEVTLFLNHS